MIDAIWCYSSYRSVCGLTVSHMYARPNVEGASIRRVLYSIEEMLELHLSVLEGVSDRFRTPFFDNLKKYAMRPISTFHALPIARGKSVFKSDWIRDMGEFYGLNIFLAESSATTGGLDSLLEPTGNIKEAQDMAARAFGADHVFFVTNGTSTSNKMVHQALVAPGDIVILDRNCHKSHHYGLVLAGGQPLYIDAFPMTEYSMYGAVPLAGTKKALLDLKAEGRLDKAKMVDLTNCTFDGHIYNTRRVMEECLAIKPDLIFLWDEAWFGFARWSPFLRPRTAMGLPPVEADLGGGTTLRFSGQINMGALSYDDGGETSTYFPIDNDNSSSRARLQLFGHLGDWSLEGIAEVEYQPFASNVVSQLDDDPVWDFSRSNIRKLESIFRSERYGTFWLGQGSMASDGSAEVDLSGTTVIAYSSVSDTSGGHFFRLGDGTLSDITVGGAFNNFDGLSRKVRIRYDTPSFAGFQLKASYGQDALNDDDASLYDVAGAYSGTLGDFELAGSVAYSWNDGNGVDRLSGSFSTLHTSGLSITVAAGAQYADGDGQYLYGKLGYQSGFFDIGSTAFSIDYYDGSDVAADGSDSSSVGLAVVQNFDAANLELWLTFRSYDYDDDVASYQSGQAIFGGARFRF
jgi:hypothetical protein